MPSRLLRPAGALVLLALLVAPSGFAHGVPDLTQDRRLDDPVAPADWTPPATPDAPAALDLVAEVPVEVLPPLAAPGFDPVGLLPDLPWAEPVNAVTVVAGTPWRILPTARNPAPVQGTIDFWCPPLDSTPSINNNYNTFTMRADCPYRIIDDADIMGSPQIAVNPANPDSVAFFSLHGAGSTQGPTPRSRDPNPETQTLTGYSHTTFLSEDHGRSWFDNPWGSEGFGEHASGVMDNDGNVYIAQLLSKRMGDGGFDYTIKLYKESEGRYQISSYSPSKTLANRADGNSVEEANLVFVAAATKFPPTDENATGDGNATAPADEGDVGNSTDGDALGPQSHPDDRVMVVWHERALDWRNATTRKSSWIDAAWTDTTDKDNWTRLADDQLIGPCMATSNPVSYNGKVYVACAADAGYRARSRAKIGDIDVWRIDPLTGETELVDRTNLNGGRPRMAARPDGYMAVSAVEHHSEQNIDVQITFGWYGTYWSAPQNAGPDLHRLIAMTGGTAVSDAQAVGGPVAAKDARVTAMTLSEDLNTLFLVYMERSNTTPSAEPNPSTADPNPTQGIEFRKLVATFDACQPGVLDAYDLQTGVARHPFQDEEAVTGGGTGVFDDLQDGMQYMRADDGTERIYFVYGDHGVIQYGALVGGSSGEPCFNFAPVEFFPPPAVPAALSATSGASTLIGASVGAVALAMVTYLLAAKRRTANTLAAKDKGR